jgi:hypothetical protein
MATSLKGSSARVDVTVHDEIAAVLRLPGISPDQLYKLGIIPLSRNGIYDACNRGEIESFRLGKKIVIPTAPLRRKLGMEVA